MKNNIKYLIIIMILFFIGCNDNTTENNCIDECNYNGEFICADGQLNICELNNGCLKANFFKKCTCYDETQCENTCNDDFHMKNNIIITIKYFILIFMFISKS